MSITLLAAAITQMVSGGQTLETNNAAAVTFMGIDWMANSITFRLQSGSVVAGVFVQATQLPNSRTIVVDLGTGNWRADSGQSGTLSAPALASIVATMKTWRNTLESFANSNGTVPGTVVAW